jgi:hypothetical protein
MTAGPQYNEGVARGGHIARSLRSLMMCRKIIVVGINLSEYSVRRYKEGVKEEKKADRIFKKREIWRTNHNHLKLAHTNLYWNRCNTASANLRTD